MIKSKTISIFNLIKNKYLFIQIVKTNNFLFKTGVISILYGNKALVTQKWQDENDNGQLSGRCI